MSGIGMEKGLIMSKKISDGDLFSGPDPITLGVVGSRKWPDKRFVFHKIEKALAEYPSLKIIVSGDQPEGVDGWAKKHAKGRDGLSYKGFPPAHWLEPDDENYKEYHVSNFFDRNTQIAKNSDILLAFCFKGSSGTLDTYKKAKKFKKVTFLFTEKDLVGDD